MALSISVQDKDDFVRINICFIWCRLSKGYREEQNPWLNPSLPSLISRNLRSSTCPSLVLRLRASISNWEVSPTTISKTIRQSNPKQDNPYATSVWSINWSLLQQCHLVDALQSVGNHGPEKVLQEDAVEAVAGDDTVMAGMAGRVVCESVYVAFEL